MNNEQLERELENKKKHNKIMLKKIMVCVCAAVILSAVAMGVMVLAESEWLVGVEYISSDDYFIPHPFEDYNYDIMQDAGYRRLLAEEPFITLSDVRSGFSQTIDPEEYDTQSEAVSMLIDLVLCIQSGDHEGYYDHFTDAYRTAELERNEFAEHSFTMQQIYNVVITKVQEQENEHSGTSTYIYRLKYKIHKNNGTFRNDLGSDSWREQELMIVNSASDPTLKINSVSIEKTVVEVPVVHGERIAAVSVGAVAIFGAVISGTVVLLKRIGKTEKEENEE